MDTARKASCPSLDPGCEAPESWRRLEHKISTLLDSEMRRYVVSDRLENEDAEDAHRVLEYALSGPVEDHPSAHVLRDLILDLLTVDVNDAPRRTLSYERRRELYEIASRHGNETTMHLLRSRPSEVASEPASDRVPKELEEISLGMRRTLAKQDDLRRLEQLSRDPDPVVIRHLLRNSRLREQDVVRIAARRPALASSLLEVARSPRWSRRTRVRVALARNPSTPVPLCTRLVATLPTVDLRAMQHDPDLHPETHRMVEREVARRTRR